MGRTMKSKNLFAYITLIAAALLTIACDKSDPTASTAKTCSELGDSLIAAAGTSIAVYKVISPNGSEVYHVGDTLRIRASGNINSANASLFLQVGSKFMRPTGLSGNLNLYSNCDMAFAIPESLLTAIGTPVTTSLISDSVKILVESYTDNTRKDLSDGYFQIKAKTTP